MVRKGIVTLYFIGLDVHFKDSEKVLCGGTSEWARRMGVAVKGSTFLEAAKKTKERKSLDFINCAYYTSIKNISMFY